MDANIDVTCEVTGFPGYEGEVLHLRNANRDKPETLAYLAWRYERRQECPPPLIFWLLTGDGHRIGMASVVFRPYWINGARVQAAVVGDISLDARWRGYGLGKHLLSFMTEHLDQNFPTHAAFVIPTEAARRTLAAVGWVTPGALVPHVYLVDATRYIQSLVRSDWVAVRIARQLRHVAHLVARVAAPRDGSLHLKSTLDLPMTEFANGFSGSGDASHDLSTDSLIWRYQQHPHTRFTFASLIRSGTVRGLLVFEDDTLERTRTIYDLVAKSDADMGGMLALLILNALSTSGIVTLRVLLNAQHPCRSQLWRLGFISRRPDAVFQVHSRTGTAERLNWRVTQGDKDT